jgi:hypothetical protein
MTQPEPRKFTVDPALRLKVTQASRAELAEELDDWKAIAHGLADEVDQLRAQLAAPPQVEPPVYTPLPTPTGIDSAPAPVPYALSEPPAPPLAYVPPFDIPPGA